MKYLVKNEVELPGVAARLIQDIGQKRVVLFYGQMGAGKTTLIKELCLAIGVDDTVTSPTFSIVNEYHDNVGDSVYHFDFYRIEDETEVLDLGYEDYFFSGSYCFIEWPEKIPNLLPDNTVKVDVEVDQNNNRLISIA